MLPSGSSFTVELTLERPRLCRCSWHSVSRGPELYHQHEGQELPAVAASEEQGPVGTALQQVGLKRLVNAHLYVSEHELPHLVIL